MTGVKLQAQSARAEAPYSTPDSVLRCVRCAERYPRRLPTCVGFACLYGRMGVLASTARHIGKREQERRRLSTRYVSEDSAHTDFGVRANGTQYRFAEYRRTLQVSCHSCGLRAFSVSLKKLRPLLLACCPTILVGPNGEVLPSDVDQQKITLWVP